jgi:hypothetical protein
MNFAPLKTKSKMRAKSQILAFTGVLTLFLVFWESPNFVHQNRCVTSDEVINH